MIRILGLDPSLVACGWGLVDAEGTRLRHVAHGVIRPKRSASLTLRLRELYDALGHIVADYGPDCAAVEEAFMKSNPSSALKLGHARAICLLAPSVAGLDVAEYAPRTIKKSVVGTGGADKTQVAAMIGVLMPGVKLSAGDAADALAIAVCHAHRAGSTLKERLSA